MAILWQDVRHGIRMLIKHRGITLFATIALAIGIGANATIFSMVNSILLSPWPFANPDRIVRIGENRIGREVQNLTLSGPNYLDWKDDCRSFAATCLVSIRYFNLTGRSAEPEEVSAYVVSPSFIEVFQAIGSSTGMGRAFAPGDDQEGDDHVAILSHGLWSESYGANPKILGEHIYLDGEAYRVIGVLPASASVFEAEARLWLPLPIKELGQGNRENRDLVAFGLLKPGVSADQAQAEMKVIAQNLAQAHEENEGWELIVEPALYNLLRATRNTLIVLHGAVAFVLLIACSNVASLLLARATARRKEISIRLAMGARRIHVLRQMLTESVLLALCGGLLGLLVAVWGIGLLKTLLPPGLMEFVTRQGVDIRLLGFTFTISVVTGVLFGIVPALRASRVDLNESLREGGRDAAGRSTSHRMLRVLVVGEVALSLVLLIGAGLMINNFIRLQRVDPGFQSRNLLICHVTLRGDRYVENQPRRNLYREVVPKIQQLPGVEAVAAASVLPMNWGVSIQFEVDGQTEDEQGEPYGAQFRCVHPDYFRALGIPIVKGRSFVAADDREESRLLVVSESLARRIWTGQDPIGKTLRIPSWGTTPYEVVGVVRDVRHFGLNNEPSPTVYVPFSDHPPTALSLAIRTRGEPLGLLPNLRRIIEESDPELPIVRPRTMDAAIAESVAMNRFGMVFLSLFSVVAMGLSAIGIYGIMAYSVSQRTHEIGIRMALGAQARDVVTLLLRQGAWLTLWGVAIGAVGAFALTRVLSAMLTTGVSATDPLTFLSTSLLLVLVALLACYLPARRSTRVDPMQTLRAE